MATVHRISQGLDIRMVGAPVPALTDLSGLPSSVTIPFAEFDGFKLKVLVKEGDVVRRGQALCRDKKCEDFHITAPLAGVVKAVHYGERRTLLGIEIEGGADAAESYPAHKPEGVLALDRAAVIKLLANAGYFPLLKRRPFSRIADPATPPKSIFVNAMATAPFRPDHAFLVQRNPIAFQAGLNALSRIATTFLCFHTRDAAFDAFANVERHAFEGPHPSGNSSTHIHRLDPILPGQTVWTIQACQVLQIGEFLLSGQVSGVKHLVLGGAGLREEARQHYLVRTGTALADVVRGRLADGPQRLIKGDVYNGLITQPEARLGFTETALTALPDHVERRFMGWIAPGPDLFSVSRTVLSRWLGGLGKTWNLHTGLNGSHRALVLTGLYDDYVPLDILVDPLARACFGRDTAEAVRQGILETDPEDFALCSVICPSKVDFPELIRGTLKLIEQEGI
jgi:Na+-transporting NADH:ubiquinone oxidoreductase subunit A